MLIRSLLDSVPAGLYCWGNVVGPVRSPLAAVEFCDVDIDILNNSGRSNASMSSEMHRWYTQFDRHTY